MAKISEAKDNRISSLLKVTEELLKGCSNLEEAAQKVVDIIYKEFLDSIVLARIFVTVPLEKLPAPNQKFVKDLAVAKNVIHLVKEKTPVLSLLSTKGEEVIWGRRTNSKGHVGIPLVSADFIELIPMISRLMKAMGIPLDWISSTDTTIVGKAVGKAAGIFYVPDAKTGVDEKNRKIIAAQDFVDRYGVKTVFGVGGGYILASTFVVMIVFARETITKDRAEQFIPILNLFKAATTNIVTQGKIFSTA